MRDSQPRTFGVARHHPLRGELIVDGERWLRREGMGEFLKRGESGRL
jgi:hypothetical protein